MICLDGDIPVPRLLTVLRKRVEPENKVGGKERGFQNSFSFLNRYFFIL